MKYIKTYESTEDIEYDIYNIIALYLEEIQPINTKNGFIECLYGTHPFELSFYFKNWTSEEEYEKFYTFLEEKGLKIFDEKSYKQNENYFNYEIIVRPNRRQLRKLKEEAEMWDTANKYNL